MSEVAGGSPEFGLVPFSVVTATSGLEFLRSMLAGRTPSPLFAASTDIWLADAQPGQVRFEARPSRRFYNPLGSVHGGWISMLLDSAMGCAVHSRLAAGEGFTTVDMTVSFVKAVSEDSGLLRCDASIVHLGGRIATAEGRVRDAAGDLVAHGTETCMILRPRDAEG